MIRPLALGLALLAGAPAARAEGGPIRGGEHAGFSRIVMEIEPTTEWSLELTGGGVTLFFPSRAIEFSTGGVFERIPRTRIQAVESRIDPSGTIVSVALGCDCRVSTAFVGARYLALDVGDRVTAIADDPQAHPTAPSAATEPPASPRAEAEDVLAAREQAAVSNAEEILLRQIERAADQGLIELAGAAAPAPDAPAPAVAEAPPPPPRPAAVTPPVLPLALGPHDIPRPASLADLLDQDQVRATTVFDRDRPASGVGAAGPPPPVECREDEAFAFAGWADARPAHAQIAAHAGGLLGEFDTPKPEALQALTRLYVRFGFGAEAEAVLAAFPVPFEDRDLLADLARAVEGRAPRPGGPLTVGAPCPGAHGLWLAIGAVAPAFNDPEHFAGVAVAFGELPADLRLLVGPPLIGRLLDADQAEAARRIYDTMARPEPERSAALVLAEARLVAAEGSPAAAMRALGDLVEGSPPNAAEALAHLARLAIDGAVPLPDRLLSDLAAATRQFRSTPLGPDLRALLAEAEARRGDIAAAVENLRIGMAESPGDPRFAALAVALLGAADPAETGAGAYAETILASRDLLPDTPDADPVRRSIAGHLLGMELARAARDIIAPAAARSDRAALLLDAEAALALGETATARAILAELDGAEVVALRARALARDGTFDTAVTTLVEAGLEPEAAAYAWPSGDWSRAEEAADDDPVRRAMARYMQARADPAAAPAPSGPDDAAGPDAFAAPLPALEPPSLAAARRLLDTGRELEDFVSDLLENR